MFQNAEIIHEKDLFSEGSNRREREREAIQEKVRLCQGLEYA